MTDRHTIGAVCHQNDDTRRTYKGCLRYGSPNLKAGTIAAKNELSAAINSERGGRLLPWRSPRPHPQTGARPKCIPSLPISPPGGM